MFRDKPLVNQEEKIPIFVQALVQTLIVETKENQKIPSSFVSCTVDACTCVLHPSSESLPGTTKPSPTLEHVY